MRQKFALLSAIVILLCALSPSIAFGAANSPISVYVNGQKLSFSAPPYEANYTTLVPMRGIFEKLGAALTYDPKTQTVKAIKNDTVVQLIVGQNVAFVNGEAVKLTTPAVQKKGVTFVPLRFVSQALSCQVAYDPSKKRIDIAYSSVPAPTVDPGSSSNADPSAASTAGSSGTSASSDNLSIEEVGKLADRVVLIKTFDAGQKPIASGSGVIVGANGEILTNDHVIEGASSASVTFSDGTSAVTQTVTLADKSRDLALLQISKTNLPTATIGDSAQLALGQQVVAIGSPLGLSGTLTVGVISAKSRVVEGETYLQTSAQIDHGSSGGALFNMHGELVGITTAFFESSANLGFAIPSNDVKQFLAQPRQILAMATVNPASSSPPPSPSGGFTTRDVQNYLSENYAALTYDGMPIDMEWIVTTSKDGSYLIGAYAQDGAQWSDWMDEQLSNPYVLPAAVAYVSDALRDRFGLTDMFISFTTDFYFDYYPASVPAEYVTRDGSGYRVRLPFIFGQADYDKNVLFYNDNPVYSDELETIPLD